MYIYLLLLTVHLFIISCFYLPLFILFNLYLFVSNRPIPQQQAQDGGQSASQQCPRSEEDEKEAAGSSPKLVLYSGQDSGIASFLATLGLRTNVDRDGYVTFAATILVELWRRPAAVQVEVEEGGSGENVENEDQFYVKVSFS
jgi:hypothetical protein